LKDLLKIKEAAQFLGVNIKTLQRWDDIGKFKALRHPINNYRLYKLEDLEKLVRRIHKK